MPTLFQYMDHEITCHHTLDQEPDPNRFYQHVHDKFEIFYLLSGNVNYIVEGNIYPMRAGDVMLTDRAEAHKVEVGSDQPYERFSIQFHAELLEKIDPQGVLLRPFRERELGSANHYPASIFSKDSVRLSYEQISSDVPDERKRLLIINTIFTIMCQICNRFETSLTSTQTRIPNTVSQQIICYVNAHMFEPITLNSIAQAFYLSQSQLARIFKNSAGFSVGEYIRTKRLIAARERIREGEAPTTAFSACGFRDYSSFYRAYTAHFGYPPSKTRNLCWKDNTNLQREI